jgi:CheY-like chemotaxis protein
MARVLLVEGDAFEAFTAALQLQGLGHEILSVTDSVKEALIMAGRTPPEVAVLNLMLKGEKDGVDLGRKLSSEYGCKVVYTSSYHFLLNSLEGHEVTLPKPYTKEELQGAIEAVLQMF